MSRKLPVMRELQESGSWSLASGEVDRLTVGPGARRIEVQAGRLWITVDDPAGGEASDLWLEAGDGASFESGARLLLEGWPHASFTLLVPPSVCPRRSRPAPGRALQPAWRWPWGGWLSSIRLGPVHDASTRHA